MAQRATGPVSYRLWANRFQWLGRMAIVAVALASLVLTATGRAQSRQADLLIRLAHHGHEIDVMAGRNNAFVLELDNIGSEAITDPRISAEHPDGWIVTLFPSALSSLDPGSTQTVEVIIRPPGDTARGAYTVAFVARASGLRRVQTYRVVVKSMWGIWIGVAVVAIVVMGFVLVFLRYGRSNPTS